MIGSQNSVQALKPQTDHRKSYQSFEYLVGLHKDYLFMFSLKEIKETLSLIQQRLGILAANTNQQLPQPQELEAFISLIECKFESSLKYFLNRFRCQDQESKKYQLLIFLIILIKQLNNIQVNQKYTQQQSYYTKILIQEYCQQKRSVFVKRFSRLYTKYMNLIKQIKQNEEVIFNLEEVQKNSNKKNKIVRLLQAKNYSRFPSETSNSNSAKVQLRKYWSITARNLRADELAATIYQKLQDYENCLKLCKWIMTNILIDQQFQRLMPKGILSKQINMLIQHKKSQMKEFKDNISQKIQNCKANMNDLRNYTVIQQEAISEAIDYYNHGSDLKQVKKILQKFYQPQKNKFCWQKKLIICQKVYKISKEKSQFDLAISYYKQYVQYYSLQKKQTIRKEIKSIMEQENISRIEYQCKKKIEQQIQKSMEQQCTKKIEQQIKKKIEQESKKKIQQEIKKIIGQQGKTTIKQQQIKKIEQKIKNKIEQQNKEKIVLQTKKKIEQQRKKMIEQQNVKQIKKLIKKKLEQDSKIKIKISQQITKKINQQIKRKIEQLMTEKMKQIFQQARFYLQQVKKPQYSNEIISLIDRKQYIYLTSQQRSILGLNHVQINMDQALNISRNNYTHQLQRQEEDLDEQKRSDAGEEILQNIVIRSNQQPNNQIQRTKQLFDKVDQIKELVGLMNFYWYDQKLNIKKVVQGTGFLISDQFVITAKHNFFQKNDPNTICHNCVIIFKNKNNQVVQYRSKPSNEWFQSQQWDLGTVFLQRPVLHFKNNIKFAHRKDYVKVKQGEQLLLSGYSYEYRSSSEPDEMKILKPISTKVSGVFCQYQEDTVAGLSGSPVFYKVQNKQICVLSMHISRRIPLRECRGLLFTQKIASQVHYWIQSKYYQQQNMKIMIREMKQKMINSITNKLGQFEQKVLIANKQANISQILQLFQQRIVSLGYSSQAIQDITCKIQKIGHQNSLSDFYNKLYKNSKNENVRKQFQRLNLEMCAIQPIQPIKQIKNKSQSKPVLQQNIQLLWVPEQQNSFFIVPTPQDQQIQQNMSFLKLISQSAPQNQMKTDYNEASRIINNKFKKELQKFVKLKEKNHLSINQSIIGQQEELNQISKLQTMNNSKIGKQFVLRQGFKNTQWFKCLNQSLFLKLIKDVCKGFLQLQNMGIYHADLQLRNIILCANEKGYCYSQFNIKKIMKSFDSFTFKFIDFQHSLSLNINNPSSNTTNQLLQLARFLYENESEDFNREPLYECINHIYRQDSQLAFKDKLQEYLKQERKLFIPNQIERLKQENKIQSLENQLTILYDYSNNGKYQQMIKYIDQQLPKFRQINQ